MRFEDESRGGERDPSNVITFERFYHRASRGHQAPTLLTGANKNFSAWVGTNPPVLQVSSPNLDPVVC